MIIGAEYKVYIMLPSPHNCGLTYAEYSFRNEIQDVFIALIQFLKLRLLHLIRNGIEFCLRVLKRSH
jgi:hypothetical protein